MQRFFTSSIIISLFLTVACTSKKYNPDFSLPSSWHETNKISERPIDHRWWLQFNDPTLNDLIAQARTNSPDIKIASARVAQARAQESGTWADQLPTIGIGADAGRTKRSSNINSSGLQPAITNNFNANFDASWELNIFGLGGATRGAKAFRQKAQAEYDQTLVTLFGDITRHYFKIRKYQAQLHVSKQNISTQKENVHLAEALNKAGQTSDADVAQAKALLSATEATLPPIRQALKESYYALRTLVGINANISLEALLAAAPTNYAPVTIDITLAAPSAMISERADIRAAHEQLNHAAALHDVAISHYFPKISLSGLFGVESNKTNLLFKGTSRALSGTGGISMPLFDFGRIRADAKATDAQALEALAQYEKTVTTALNEIEAALASYINEQQHYNDLTALVNTNQLSLNFAKARYKEGLSNYLNVTDAQKSLNEALIQQTDSLFESYIQLVRLYKALGGGWK